MAQFSPFRNITGLEEPDEGKGDDHHHFLKEFIHFTLKNAIFRVNFKISFKDLSPSFSELKMQPT